MAPAQFIVPHVFGPVLSKNDLIRSGDGGCSAERLARCAPKWTSESYLKHLVGTTAGLIAQVYSARECSAGVWRGYIVERRKEPVSGHPAARIGRSRAPSSASLHLSTATDTESEWDVPHCLTQPIKTCIYTIYIQLHIRSMYGSMMCTRKGSVLIKNITFMSYVGILQKRNV
jgi:hypothetical protein